MPVLILILLLAVLAYFIWRARTSSLSRNCRWRQEKARGQWRCAYCGAVEPGAEAPRICRNRSGR
jgi:hypothetical protein